MSTSKLQRKVRDLLANKLSRQEIYENYRPEWLDGLELDFYIPSCGLAFEIQGRQHYEYTPWFHKTSSEFQDQLERDQKKREICAKIGIRLIEIASSSDFVYIDSLDIVRSTEDSLWKAADEKRWTLHHTQISKEVKVRIKTLHKLGNSLRWWRQMPNSEEKCRVITKIGRKISIHSQFVQDWFSGQITRANLYKKDKTRWEDAV